MRNMCDPVTDHYLLSREADGSWEELLWFAGCLGNWTYVVCHLIGQKAPPFLRNDCSWRPPQLGEARLIPFLAIPWHCPYESSNSLSFTRRNSILPHALKPVHSYLSCVWWILSRPWYTVFPVYTQISKVVVLLRLSVLNVLFICPMSARFFNFTFWAWLWIQFRQILPCYCKTAVIWRGVV